MLWTEILGFVTGVASVWLYVRLGARHVSIDPERLAFPVSGTAVRSDPAGHWRFLEPCVRAYDAR